MVVVGESRVTPLPASRGRHGSCPLPHRKGARNALRGDGGSLRHLCAVANTLPNRFDCLLYRVDGRVARHIRSLSFPGNGWQVRY